MVVRVINHAAHVQLLHVISSYIFILLSMTCHSSVAYKGIVLLYILRPAICDLKAMAITICNCSQFAISISEQGVSSNGHYIVSG